MNFSHIEIWAAKRTLNSAGEFAGAGSAPSAVIRARMSGDWMI